MSDGGRLDIALEVAREAAHAAGQVLLSHQGRLVTASRKADGSVVSVADHDAEQVIRDRLSHAFPSDRILGEEHGLSGAGDRCWVIDPLDNSACFVRGSAEYAVLIALLDGHWPVLGVVATPANGEMFWSAHRRGAWSSNGRRLTCSSTALLSQSTISYASLRSWRALKLEKALGTVADVAFHESLHGGFRAMLGVASGTIDLCLDPWGKLWDHAALVSLLTESGAVCRRVPSADGQVGLVTGPSALVEEVRARGMPLTRTEWSASSYSTSE